MRSLSFKQRYIEGILSGDKTSTLRKQAGRLAQGDVIAATCVWTDPPFAHLRVTAVEAVGIGDLTDGIARDDGFESAVELRKELAALYPGLETLTRICFEVAQPA